MINELFLQELTKTVEKAVRKEVIGPSILIDPDGNFKPLISYLDANGISKTEIFESKNYVKPPAIELSQGIIEVDSFLRYCNEFKIEGTRIFGFLCQSVFTCSFDYPLKDEPKHQTHFCHLHLQPSEDWKQWSLFCDNWVTQEVFVDALETLDHTIIEPDGAAMRTIIQQLHITKDFQLTSQYDPGSGSIRFNYIDEIQHNGTFKVPKEFFVSMAPYRSMDPLTVRVRLRHRVEGSKVKFECHVMQSEQILDQAFKDVAKQIAEATGMDPHIC